MLQWSNWMPENGLNEAQYEHFRYSGELMFSAGEQMMEAHKQHGNLNVRMPKLKYLKPISHESSGPSKKKKKKKHLPLPENCKNSGGRPQGDNRQMKTLMTRRAQHNRQLENFD